MERPARPLCDGPVIRQKEDFDREKCKSKDLSLFLYIDMSLEQTFWINDYVLYVILYLSPNLVEWNMEPVALERLKERIFQREEQRKQSLLPIYLYDALGLFHQNQKTNKGPPSADISNVDHNPPAR